MTRVFIAAAILGTVALVFAAGDKETAEPTNSRNLIANGVIIETRHMVQRVGHVRPTAAIVKGALGAVPSRVGDGGSVAPLLGTGVW